MSYLVIYECRDRICSVEIDFKEFPPTIHDIRDVEKELQDKYKYTDAPIITNILPLSDNNPKLANRDDFRDMAKERFDMVEDEAGLNDIYDELRELIVLALSDRAEELGTDPDKI